MERTGKKCKVCGHMFHRDECDFCLRAERWEIIEKYKRRKQLFPTRIVDDLQALDIRVELHPSVYFHGKVGTGKTLHAAQLLMDLSRRSYIEHLGQTCYFVKVSKLLMEFKDAFNEVGGETRIINKYVAFDYLVLDDLGAEKITDWIFKLLYILIDARYEEKKGIIITSNVSINELAAGLEDTRLTSRLTQMCLPKLLTGKDNRKQVWND